MKEEFDREVEKGERNEGLEPIYQRFIDYNRKQKIGDEYLKILSSALSFKVRRSKEIEKEEKAPKIISYRKGKKKTSSKSDEKKKKKKNQVFSTANIVHNSFSTEEKERILFFTETENDTNYEKCTN